MKNTQLRTDRSINTEGLLELARTIILQAIEDFRPAYLRLKKAPNDKAAAYRVKEITKFFCSEYFSLLTDTDGPKLLRKIIAQLERERRGGEKFIPWTRTYWRP